ncbi:MAG: FkbM family methyltransferase [Planctomycetaceae bacterium]
MSTVDIKLPGLAAFKLAVHRGPDLHISPHLLRYGIWEPAVTSYILGAIRTGQNVVDVGAHIGYFTIIMSLLVGEGGKVFAFEPEPCNFDLLRTNLDLNGIRNVSAERKAVSDQAGRAGLHLSSCNTGDHRLYGPPLEREVHEVDTVALDGYFDGTGKPVHFVKIDAQGLEPKILDGMGSLIERNRHWLILLMEFSPGLLRSAGCDLGNFLRCVEALDAALFWLNKGRAGRLITRATARDLRGIADLMLRMKDEDYSADIILCFDH